MYNFRAKKSSKKINITLRNFRNLFISVFIVFDFCCCWKARCQWFYCNYVTLRAWMDGWLIFKTFRLLNLTYMKYLMSLWYMLNNSVSKYWIKHQFEYATQIKIKWNKVIYNIKFVLLNCLLKLVKPSHLWNDSWSNGDNSGDYKTVA